MNNGSNSKVIHNTLMLYVRMTFVILVGLYTSRAILNALGVNDFGIYNVVCGIVLIFQSFNSSLSLATSRFLSLELSNDNLERLKQVFSVSVAIHWAIAILVLIICETIGMWFLENKLVISPDRIYAAKIVLHFSTIAFALSLLQLPYYACIVAHEEMDFIAYISIIESLLKLIMVYLLINFGKDKLILYAFLMLCISIIVTLSYYIYSRKKYKETKFVFIKEKSMYKPVFNFFGWNFFENLSILAHQSGINFLQNMFFGVGINAAMGVATQVRNNLRTFQTNFMLAAQPYIFKKYSSDSIENFETVVISTMKISYVLLAVFFVPMCFEVDYILKLWLKNPPVCSSEFCIWFLIFSFTCSITYPLQIAVQATGKNKDLSLYGGLCYASAVPIAYTVLLYGGTYNTAVIISTLIGFLYNLLTFVFLKKEIKQISLIKISVKALMPMIAVTSLSIAIAYFTHISIVSEIPRFIATVLVGFFSTALISFFILLNKYEKNLILSVIKKKISFS